MLRDLVEPLWLPIIGLAAVWAYLHRRRQLTRLITIAGTTIIAVLWLVCTPLVAFILERPLMTESTIIDDWSPQYIFVLSAGYDIGDQPEEDSAGLETIRRVNRAVLLWRDHRSATLVMAGAQPGMDGLREPQQQGLLMQAHAEMRGVPAANIIIDAESLNTNGHAKVARDSALFSPDTALAIVSSDFHLRRARREVSRYFTNIRLFGSDPIITDDSFTDLSLRSLIPRVDAVRESTTYLREYAALILSDVRN